MGCYEGWNDTHPNDFYPSGLAPDEVASVTRVLEPDRWSIAEERTAELIACILPNQLSEERRRAVTSYVQRLITNCFSCQVLSFGSVPLKTYLPDGDGDINLTAFGNNESSKDTWANEVRDMLMSEEKNENAEFCVIEVQYIQAEVKCLVDDIEVNISFNQLDGFHALCFLEEVDGLLRQNHLFKRSILLIKAWCYYESQILGAHHGLISTYALETLVLYIFYVFNNSFAGPLEVLYRFLEFFSKFDWDNFCVGLWGPVPIRSLPDMTADPPRKDGGELLLSKLFLDACSSVYSLCAIGQENHELPFMSKHFNVIDPLEANNNLGRSVRKGNFFWIRSALAFGAQRLTRLLDCSKENIVAEVNQFFMNTLNRHGKQLRHDAPRLLPVNMGWTNAHPNDFYPSGLAPDEVASVTRVRDMLMSEEKNENAEFCVMEVQYIQAEVWLGKEFQINYPNLNCKIKNLLYGSTYEVQCWTTNPLDFKNKIVHMMKNQQEAIQLKNILESIKHSSICDKYDVGTCQNASTVVSREEFVGDTLTAWIAKLKSAWEYNKSERWIGLGTNTKSVLRTILRGLQAIHNAGAYHGNIKEGVRISPQNEVMIATSTYVTTVGSVEDGIRKDIGDFQDIVKMVVRDHPITPPTPRPGAPPAAVPRVVEIFYTLCALLPKNTTQQDSLQVLRDFCFFIYNTPLVWEGEERFLFKDIVWNIKNRNDRQFQTMWFDKNLTDMTNWQERIPIDKKSTLYTILMYNQTGGVNHNLKYPNAMYNYKRGFVDFERNFLVHYQTHATIKLRKKSRLEIERQIYNILPESCSVVYYALVRRFQNSSTLFFRDNLEKMFKAKPSPCY